MVTVAHQTATLNKAGHAAEEHLLRLIHAHQFAAMALSEVQSNVTMITLLTVTDVAAAARLRTVGGVVLTQPMDGLLAHQSVEMDSKSAQSHAMTETLFQVTVAALLAQLRLGSPALEVHLRLPQYALTSAEIKRL